MLKRVQFEGKSHVPGFSKSNETDRFNGHRQALGSLVSLPGNRHAALLDRSNFELSVVNQFMAVSRDGSAY
jgi:hypothetical protein